MASAPWVRSSPETDERFLEGRRRRILAEHTRLARINDESDGKVVVLGAGYLGLELAVGIAEKFPNIGILVNDVYPRCLGSFPEAAANHAFEVLERHKIETTERN